MLTKCQLKKTFLAAVMAGGLITSGPALAWGIVFDPTNFMANDFTAIKTAASYMNSLQMRITQLQDHIMQIENLATLPMQAVNTVMAPVQQMMYEKQMATQQLYQVQSLYTNLGYQSSNLQNMYQSYMASGLTPQNYYNAESNMANGYNNTGLNQMHSVVSSIPVINHEYSQIQATGALIPGTKSTNSQLGLLETEGNQQNAEGMQFIQGVNQLVASSANNNIRRAAKQKQRMQNNMLQSAVIANNAAALAGAAKSYAGQSNISSNIASMAQKSGLNSSASGQYLNNSNGTSFGSGSNLTAFSSSGK
jgi:hypothetical protein